MLPRLPSGPPARRWPLESLQPAQPSEPAESPQTTQICSTASGRPIGRIAGNLTDSTGIAMESS
jgi:hypothetical protein